MRILLVFATTLALAGCHHRPPTSEPFIGPDGRAFHVVDCSGPKATIALCHTRARAICNGGDYDVTRQSDTPRLATSKMTGAHSTSIERKLEISCKS